MKKSKIKIHRKAKLGLVLGGGGGLGVAHIGAIKAFEELGIDFQYVAGTSAGSLVGALYASGKTSKELTAIAKKLKVKDITSNATGSTFSGILKLSFIATGLKCITQQVPTPSFCAASIR